MAHNLYGAKLNTYSDQYRGLLGAIAPITGVARVLPSGNALYASSGSFYWGHGELGLALHRPTVTDSIIRGIFRTGPIPLHGTVTCWFEKLNQPDASEQPPFIIWRWESAPQFSVYIQLNSYSGAPYWITRGALAHADYTWTTIPVDSPGGTPLYIPHFCALTWEHDGTDYNTSITRISLQNMYTNVGSNTKAIDTPSGEGRVSFGDNSETVTADYNTYESRLYDRVLTDQEIMELYQPDTRWDLYRTTKPQYWMIPSGTGGYPFVKKVITIPGMRQDAPGQLGR